MPQLTGATHVASILQVSQWLPVVFRAQSKVLVMTHKALYHLGPENLKDHLPLQVSAEPLRSSGEGLLQVPPLAEARLVATKEGVFSFAVCSKAAYKMKN